MVGPDGTRVIVFGRIMNFAGSRVEQESELFVFAMPEDGGPVLPVEAPERAGPQGTGDLRARSDASQRTWYVSKSADLTTLDGDWEAEILISPDERRPLSFVAALMPEVRTSGGGVCAGGLCPAGADPTRSELLATYAVAGPEKAIVRSPPFSASPKEN